MLSEQAPQIHRISVTVTQPDHPAVTKRKEKSQKFIRVKSHDKKEAMHLATKHYRKRGYLVHDAEHVGIVEEVQEMHEAIKVGDKVHVGHAKKGGAGYKGVVTKIDGGKVHFRSEEESKFGPRTFIGKLSNASKVEESVEDTTGQDLEECSCEIESEKVEEAAKWRKSSAAEPDEDASVERHYETGGKSTGALKVKGVKKGDTGGMYDRSALENRRKAQITKGKTTKASNASLKARIRANLQKEESDQMDEQYVIHKGKHEPGTKSSLEGTHHGVTVKAVYTDKKEAQAHADKINAGRGYKPGDSKNPLYGGVLYQVSPRKNMSEEVEQIDELKKSTVASYIQKAARSYGRDKQVIGRESPDGMVKNARPELQRALKNRLKGIDRASARLAKEEAEQMEEGARGDYLRKLKNRFRGVESSLKKMSGGPSKTQKTMRTLTRAVSKMSDADVASGLKKFQKEETEQVDENTYKYLRAQGVPAHRADKLAHEYGSASKRPFDRYEIPKRDSWKAEDIGKHTVHINGKPWKEFGDRHSATAAANNVAAKTGKHVEVKNEKGSITAHYNVPRSKMPTYGPGGSVKSESVQEATRKLSTSERLERNMKRAGWDAEAARKRLKDIESKYSGLDDLTREVLAKRGIKV